jgi:hypothetical protein
MPASTLKKKPTLSETVLKDFPPVPQRRPISTWLYPLLVLASFLLGILTSYMAWGHKPQANVAGVVQSVASLPDASSDNGNKMDLTALMEQVNPPEGYKLPVRYGDLGPRLLKSGVINYDAFTAIYETSGNPLTPAQVELLKKGNDEPIVITPENAHYLLNFFWAVGLVNKNPILTAGAMTKYSNSQIENFASTGGWTLGTKPVAKLYASVNLIPLTPEQQARVEEVASAVYRPCCNNSTIFPDCNHGMAMLGLLELMASQNSSVQEMFTAAKYVNAYWFPQQALETAIYLKANQDVEFAQADSQLVTGKNFSSASGSGNIYSSLQTSGLLPKTPGGGGNCGN